MGIITKYGRRIGKYQGIDLKMGIPLFKDRKYRRRQQYITQVLQLDNQYTLNFGKIGFIAEITIHYRCR